MAPITNDPPLPTGGTAPAKQRRGRDKAIPVEFPSCLSVYSVLVVKSHANTTTLLYLCFVIN